MKTNIRKQIPIAASLYLGQFMVGFTLGWSAPVIPKLKDPDEPVLGDPISESQASWLGSVLILGSIFGPYLTGHLNDFLGRKPCLLIGGGIFVVGYVMLGLANNIAFVMAGRVMAGIACGIVFVTNLVYLGEIASTHIRGTILTLTGFSSTLGTLFMYSVGPFVSYQVTCWIGAGISGGFVILVFFVVPETPAFKVLDGKKEEAIEILTSLGRKDDLDNVVAAVNEKPGSNVAQFTEIFTIKANRKAFFIIIVLNIAQHMSGVMVVVFFVTTIFEQTESDLESNISSIIIGVTQVCAGSLAPLLVERTGRKLLLLVSTAVCSISLAALGIYFYLNEIDHPSAEQISWLALVSLIIFFIGFSIGFGIIPNTFIGEMFSANVRSLASTLSVTTGWMFGFGVSTAFGYMMPAWGAAVTFWIFAGACAFACIFSVMFVPETKGKGLLEIQNMLSK